MPDDELTTVRHRVPERDLLELTRARADTARIRLLANTTEIASASMGALTYFREAQRAEQHLELLKNDLSFYRFARRIRKRQIYSCAFLIVIVLRK
jgi:hypothetical protein